MIIIKTPEQIEGIRRAARAARSVLDFIAPFVKPGVSTKELDERIYEYITETLGGEPTFLGYRGFPASACISINEEVVHGIPSPERVIKPGDVVKIDVGVTLDGFVGDVADTFLVEPASELAKRLVKATREAFWKAVKVIKEGARLGDIGHAVQSHVARYGFRPVRELAGHGVGVKLHEDPLVPNYGRPGEGLRLRAGMTLAIEPMISAGTARVRTLPDGWTVVTADGSLAAHYEHDVLVKPTGAEVLSLLSSSFPL